MGGGAKTGPTASGSDEPKLAPDFLERGERLVQIVPTVRGGDLAADARLSLRHDRKAEAGDEDAFREQEVAHPNGIRRLAQDDRDNGSLSGERLESELQQVLAEVSRVLSQRGDPLGVRLQVAYALE